MQNRWSQDNRICAAKIFFLFKFRWLNRTANVWHEFGSLVKLRCLKLLWLLQMEHKCNENFTHQFRIPLYIHSI